MGLHPQGLDGRPVLDIGGLVEVGGVVDQVPHALQELHLFPLEFQEEVPGGGDEEHLFFLHNDASLHTVTLVWLSRGRLCHFRRENAPGGQKSQ